MLLPHEPQNVTRHRSSGAFTLIELIVVLGISVTVYTLLGPAIAALKGSNTVTTAAYQIQGALDEARTYAVSNHTYTWVGFFEEDISNGNATPAKAGIGRLVISVVASKDGTSIYNKALATATPPPLQIIPSSNLIQIGKPVKLDNIHVFDATGQTVGNRQAGIVKQTDLVGLSSQSPLFCFQYPLGGSARYIFGTGPAQTANGTVLSGIVQFTPQGESSSETKAASGMAPCKEITIQQSHGTHPADIHNIVVLDISGLTGKSTVYRR